MEVRINYPVRLITLSSGYSLEGKTGQVTTELDLNATAEERKLKGILTWDTDETPLVTLRKVSAIIKHPSLAQVTPSAPTFGIL